MKSSNPSFHWQTWTFDNKFLLGPLFEWLHRLVVSNIDIKKFVEINPLPFGKSQLRKFDAHWLLLMHWYLRRFAFHVWIEQRSSKQSNNIGKSPDAFSKVSCCYAILSSFKGKKFTKNNGNKWLLFPKMLLWKISHFLAPNLKDIIQSTWQNFGYYGNI